MEYRREGVTHQSLASTPISGVWHAVTGGKANISGVADAGLHLSSEPRILKGTNLPAVVGRGRGCAAVA
jgi:hypothetical protein